MHLRRVSADDAITIGRVNSNLLLLHILMLLVTPLQSARVAATLRRPVLQEQWPCRHLSPGLVTP